MTPGSKDFQKLKVCKMPWTNLEDMEKGRKWSSNSFNAIHDLSNITVSIMDSKCGQLHIISDLLQKYK